MTDDKLEAAMEELLEASAEDGSGDYGDMWYVLVCLYRRYREYCSEELEDMLRREIESTYDNFKKNYHYIETMTVYPEQKVMKRALKRKY